MVIWVTFFKQNAQASVDQSVQLFEFEQYKDMFNSLQEGVIVFDLPTDDKPSYRVFFINELMQSIMDLLIETARSSLGKIQSSMDHSIFYVYRSEFNKNQGQGQGQGQPFSQELTKLSLSEIIELTQSQLSQMVFMFSDQNLKLLDGNDYTQMQDVLKNCAIFRDADIDVVPKYKFFQIKKSFIPNSKRLLIQFIDISAKIFYDDVKAQEEYMNITTSTISHEMRNPLNSIMAQCTVLVMICVELATFINSIKHKLTPSELA